MNITLINDLLLIRRLPDEPPKTEWGFLLPPTDEHANTPLRGVVLAAGPGRRPKLAPAGKRVVKALETAIAAAPAPAVAEEGANALLAQLEAPERVPMHVHVGDKVIFSKHGFQTFRIDGEDLLVTQEASILGIIEE